MGQFFEQFDLILSPTMATPPPRVGELSLSREDGGAYVEALLGTIGFTQLFNVSGSPAMSVPLAWNRAGLPIGIQFAADQGGEGKLLRLAAQLEEARPWRDRRPVISAG